MQLKESSSDHKQWVNVLELFAYGTWQDYKNGKGKYPILSQKQQDKLKSLTVVTMCENRRRVPFSEFMEHLEFSSVKEVERFLVLHCIYPEIIRGKLDEKEQEFRIEGAISRDVSPEKFDKMTTALGEWLEHAGAMVSFLDAQMENLDSTWAKVSARATAREMELKQLRDRARSVGKEAMGSRYMEATDPPGQHIDRPADDAADASRLSKRRR
jgi:COP9 signalosome complex subunit 7